VGRLNALGIEWQLLFLALGSPHSWRGGGVKPLIRSVYSLTMV